MVRLNSLVVLFTLLNIAGVSQADILCNVAGQATVVHSKSCPKNSKKIKLSTLISLDVGERGDIGATGKAGPKGVKGDKGPKGPNGLKGETGATGRTGSKGVRGAAGAVGPKGQTGDVGDIGATGAKGVQGPKGDAGFGVGPKGLDGAKGPRGPTGDEGPVGARGNPGANGTMEPLSSCILYPVVSLVPVTPDPNTTANYDDRLVNPNCPVQYPFLWKHSFNSSIWSTQTQLKTPPIVKFKISTANPLNDNLNYSYPTGLNVTFRLSKINNKFENAQYLADLVCCRFE